MIKVIAFDVFGTVVDFARTPVEEVKHYARQLKYFKETKEWKPLDLPQSWENLPTHYDSPIGLNLLRTKYIVVTCSNGPLGLMTKLLKNNYCHFDAIIPLEMNKVYKPDHRAYKTVLDTFNLKPEEMMMVTANRDFGDIEAAKELGIQPMYIRNRSKVKDIIDLYQHLKEGTIPQYE